MKDYICKSKYMTRANTEAIVEVLESQLPGEIVQGSYVSYYHCLKVGCQAEGRYFPQEQFIWYAENENVPFGTVPAMLIQLELNNRVKNAILQNWMVYVKDGKLMVTLEVSHPNMLPADWTPEDGL